MSLKIIFCAKLLGCCVTNSLAPYSHRSFPPVTLSAILKPELYETYKLEFHFTSTSNVIRALVFQKVYPSDIPCNWKVLTPAQQVCKWCVPWRSTQYLEACLSFRMYITFTPVRNLTASLSTNFTTPLCIGLLDRISAKLESNCGKYG
jgi:hypothetical protein